MTIFQLLMLGASAFFAYKIYEHIQTLQDPQDGEKGNGRAQTPQRTAEAFSTFESSSLIEKADEARENGELDKALAIYSEANIKEPHNAETLFKMGYTLKEQERYDEAVEYFIESLEQDDANPFSYLELSNVYKELGDEEKAQKCYEKAIAIEPDLKRD